MSDWYETVVDTDATKAEAGDLASAVLKVLITRRLVHPEATDCALADPGHRPDVGVSDLLRQPDELLFRLATNGLAVITGRSVHVPPGVERITCPLCTAVVEDLRSVGWSDAVGDWYDGGSGSLTCPGCSRKAPVVGWRHFPNAAFGNLAFTFWNWPPFLPELWVTTPAEIIQAEILHRCEIVSGRL